ncbi:hypothetical protein [Candidatus Nucleicultrix amoebiphila]|uniref:Uncharacterized protein n=1 Tax=Candidatus Nucleicultrix amoebiphila FS5 TaxID=1414854 RepID=A0A1W6N2E8_9PROT|nr:hypothetical protein [Candidatus Nucleicultrix amoebiphila]ARN84040.1 hypothetical protein GQ61_00240 [Candidatus Nucleicultrix amoebiphila FS5]
MVRNGLLVASICLLSAKYVAATPTCNIGKLEARVFVLEQLIKQKETLNQISNLSAAHAFTNTAAKVDKTKMSSDAKKEFDATIADLKSTTDKFDSLMGKVAADTFTLSNELQTLEKSLKEAKAAFYKCRFEYVSSGDESKRYNLPGDEGTVNDITIKK